MEVIMLNLSVFSHNHHPSGVNLLAKYIRRGIWVLDVLHQFQANHEIVLLVEHSNLVFSQNQVFPKILVIHYNQAKNFVLLEKLPVRFHLPF